MKRRRVIAVLLSMVVGTLLGFLNPSKAEANKTGYICILEYWPAKSVQGNHGMIYTTIYSGPQCTGAWQGYVVFWSAGATSTYCPTYTLPSEAQILAMLNTLELAAVNSQKVILDTYNNPVCGSSITTYGK
jgi:hypothetical protein